MISPKFSSNDFLSGVKGARARFNAKKHAGARANTQTFDYQPGAKPKTTLGQSPKIKKSGNGENLDQKA